MDSAIGFIHSHLYCLADSPDRMDGLSGSDHQGQSQAPQTIFNFIQQRRIAQ